MEKCGVAVCGPQGVLAHRVIDIGGLRDLSIRWMAAYDIEVIIVGNQTGHKRVFDIMAGMNVPVKSVAESGSTLAARRRYFQDHPPTGWRRLLPVSFQVPPEAYDDYAAVVLAEAYLAADHDPP